VRRRRRFRRFQVLRHEQSPNRGAYSSWLVFGHEYSLILSVKAVGCHWAPHYAVIRGMGLRVVPGQRQLTVAGRASQDVSETHDARYRLSKRSARLAALRWSEINAFFVFRSDPSTKHARFRRLVPKIPPSRCQVIILALQCHAAGRWPRRR